MAFRWSKVFLDRSFSEESEELWESVGEGESLSEVRDVEVVGRATNGGVGGEGCGGSGRHLFGATSLLRNFGGSGGNLRCAATGRISRGAGGISLKKEEVKHGLT